MPYPDGVAARLADQRRRVRAEGLAEPGGVGAERGERRVRRVVAPQAVHQLGCGRRAPAAQQQGGEQRALLRRTGADRLVAPPGSDRSEHGEAQVSAPRLLLLAGHHLPLPGLLVARVSLPCLRLVR